MKVKEVFQYVISFIVLILVFNVLLFLACSFDSKYVEDQVEESLPILQKQGMFYVLSDVLDIQINNSTDTVILNEAYSVDYHHPFISYMKARKNYKEGLTTDELLEDTGEGITVNYHSDTKEESHDEYQPIEELQDFLSGRIHTSVNYGRYWHGYLILYRPLLLLFNITQIRSLLLVIYLLLFSYLMYLIDKRFHSTIAFIYGASLLFTGYLTASVSLESTPIFLVTMISAIILMKRLDKIKNFGLFIFIVACIVNYFDYLTVPLISWGMLCSLYLLKMLEEKKDFKESFRFVVIHSLIWFVGYSLTWIFKWAFYDLVIHDGNSMLKIGFIQSFYRMGRVNEANPYSNYLRVTLYLLGRASFYTMICASIMFIKHRFQMNSDGHPKMVFTFLLFTLCPIVWYLLLANHTLIHYYFTYRLTFLYILGILLFLYGMLLREPVIHEKKKKTKKH